MTGPEILFFLYVVPVLVCVLMAWMIQLGADTGDRREVFFGGVAFIPVANIFGAVISVMLMLGFLGIIIVQLPTIIKTIFQKGE